MNFSRPIRINLVLIITLSCFGLILAKLFFMQVIDQDVYTNRVDYATKRSQVLSAKRGEIYDRNFTKPLATNFDTFVAYLSPEAENQSIIAEVLNRLSNLINVPVDRLSQKIPKDLKLYKSVELRSGLTYADIVKIAEHKDELPGVTWQIEPLRSYPMQKAVSEVLGYVGEITPEELQILYNRGYTTNSVIGKSGIEKSYDALLRGKDGLKFKRVDAQGRSVEAGSEITIPPTAGKTLVLTIDAKIQLLAAKALGKRLGSVVVLKPSTGDILAMVSYPSYDPNLFYSEGANQVFAALSRDPASPFLNRAIQSAAPPASTFKVLMTTAVLEEKAFPKTATVFCSGSLQIGNRRFNCHLLTGHGYVNLFDALAESCNVYFFTMGTEHLGVDRIDDYAYRFGLGEISGIDLPGEVSGNVPTPEWKQQVVKTPWVGGDTANLSIGQGFVTTTPLQMANLVAMIVNNGVVYQPHVLKEVRDPVTKEVIQQYQPKVLRESKFAPETLQEVRAAMRGVVTRGTAQPVITTKAVQIAAKTGTGQTASLDADLHSWFISFAPYDYQSPSEAVVVVVWVDAANAFEWWAPKAANIIMHGIFTNTTYEEAVRDLQPLWYLGAPENFDDEVKANP